MKLNIIYLIIFSFISFSCQQNKCKSNPKEIQRTTKIAIGENLMSFFAMTTKGTKFDPLHLKGDFVLLYYKKISPDKNGHIHSVIKLNEEIEDSFLWNAIQKKNGNIIISNGLKSAGIYGVKVDENLQFKHNTLFVANKNKIITHIYIDICEVDIIKLVNEKL